MKRFIKVALAFMLILMTVLPVMQPQTTLAADTTQQYADGEYDLPFEVWQADKDEVSVADNYLEKPAKLVIENGEYTVQATLKNDSWWQYFKTKTASGDFVDVEIISEDKAEDTSVVQFKVEDVDQILNAKIHIKINGLPGMPTFEYDNHYDIRFNFDASDIPLASEPEPEPEAEPEIIELQDGNYTIGFEALHATKEETSGMGRYLDSTALLAVKDGKTNLTLKLTDHKTVTGFQVEHNGELVYESTKEIDEGENTRAVTFELDNITAVMKAQVQYSAPMGEGKFHHGDQPLRLAFDKNSLEAVVVEEPEEETPADEHDLPFIVWQADKDEVSVADGYLEKPAKVTEENGEYIVQATLKNSSWWQYFRTETTPGNFKDVEILSENEEAGTSVVQFKVQDIKEILNAKVHIIVTGIPGLVYDNKYDIRFNFDTSDIPLVPEPESTPEPTPEPEIIELQDGNYTIGLEALHATKEETSGMGRYIDSTARLAVKDGKTNLTLTLTDDKTVTGFQVEHDGELVSESTKEIDEGKNTRAVTFELDNITTVMKAQVQYTAVMGNGNLHHGDQPLRLAFDKESVKEVVAEEPEETPTDEHDLPFIVWQADKDEVSVADGYLEKPAKVTEKNGEYIVQATLKNSSWWQYFKTETATGDFVDVETISEDEATDTKVVQFKVQDTDQILNAKIHVIVPMINYDNKYDIRFKFGENDDSSEPEEPEEPELPEQPGTELQDGEYKAGLKFGEGMSEEVKAVLNKYLGEESSASIFVKDGKKEVKLSLLEKQAIASFGVWDGKEFVDQAIDASGAVIFNVDQLASTVKVKMGVQVEVQTEEEPVVESEAPSENEVASEEDPVREEESATEEPVTEEELATKDEQATEDDSTSQDNPSTEDKLTPEEGSLTEEDSSQEDSSTESESKPEESTKENGSSNEKSEQNETESVRIAAVDPVYNIEYYEFELSFDTIESTDPKEEPEEPKEENPKEENPEEDPKPTDPKPETPKPENPKPVNPGKYKDGEYHLPFTVLQASKNETSVAHSYLDPTALLIVKDGEYTVRTTLNNSSWWQYFKIETASGSFADVKVISENKAEDTSVVEFKVKDIDQILNAKIHVIVTGIPGFDYDNKYDIRFSFDTRNMTPSSEPKPQPQPKPEIPLPEIPKQPKQYEDGEYNLPFEILQGTTNERSMTNDYLQTPAKLIAKDGKYEIIVTLNNSSWWKYLKTQSKQPGSFSDSNFVDAKVISEDKDADTRVVKFTVQDLDEFLNAKIHVIVPMINYDNKYDIRFSFDTSRMTPAKGEEIVPPPVPKPIELKQGKYTIDFNFAGMTEEQKKVISKYFGTSAIVSVKDGEKQIQLTLKEQRTITSFLVKEDGKLLPVKVIETDEAKDTRMISFEVDKFIPNIEIQFEVQEQNGVKVSAAGSANKVMHTFNLSFDENSIKEKVVENPKPEVPTEENKYANGEYNLPFTILKDSNNEHSMTNDYLKSPAKLIVKDGKYEVIVTLNNSSWWQYFKVQTDQSGSFSDSNFIDVTVLSEDKATDTRVVKFTVKDIDKILNAKIHVIVTGIPGLNYDNKYDIRFLFDTKGMSLISEEEQDPETKPETDPAPEQKPETDSESKVDSDADSNSDVLTPPGKNQNKKETGTNDDRLAFDRDADVAGKQSSKGKTVNSGGQGDNPKTADTTNTANIIVLVLLLVGSLVLLVLNSRKRSLA